MTPITTLPEHLRPMVEKAAKEHRAALGDTND
jgi:hypothetical protein